MKTTFIAPRIAVLPGACTAITVAASRKFALTGINLKGVFEMNKGISIALVTVGILLIIWGVNVSHSFSSDVSRFFTGSPTNKAVWLLIGGIVAVIVGLFSWFR